jgi:hypothetical protein
LRTKAYLTNEAQFKPNLVTKSKKHNIYRNRVDWAKYDEWVNREYRPKSAYDRIRNAKAYAHCLFENDCTELVTLSNDKQEHIMNALSCRSKYLGIYENWSHMIKNYGLKWRIRNDDLLSGALLRRKTPMNCSHGFAK